MRVLNQHVPLPTVIAVASEYAAAWASVYLAGFARFGTTWPNEGDTSPSMPKALVFAALVVVSLAAMGLYQPDYRRLSREAIVARIVVGVIRLMAAAYVPKKTCTEPGTKPLPVMVTFVGPKR